MKSSGLRPVLGIYLFALANFGCATETAGVVTASDGVEIHFDRQGNNSPALVFVHGWANDRTIWDAQVAYFASNYEVISIDLPGFGESGNNRHYFSIAGFGQDVATVIEELGLSKVVLVGFSAGAGVVISTAAEIPERVVGVVLVEGLHDIEMETPESAVDAVLAFYLDLVADPTNEKLVGGGFYMKNQEESFQRVAAMLHGAPRVGWRESLVDAIRWREEECIGLLKQLQVPVTAIYAELRPINIEAFRKYVPSFRARTIPDAGHLVMWDAPQEFNRLLEQSIQELRAESE